MNQFPAMLADYLIVCLVEEISLRSVGPDDLELLVQEEDAILNRVENRVPSEDRILDGCSSARPPTTE